MSTHELEKEHEDGVRSHPGWISHYLIEGVLGEGAYGCVYLALDIRLDRKVALKLLKNVESSDGWRFEMETHEARVMAGLDHPNLVPIFDIGETEDGITYFVSKYIDGGSFADYMAGKDTGELREGVSILAAIARALHYAHEHNLVHRDVKPDNILIDRFCRPYLIDFGLVLVRENFARGGGTRLGTPPYMSPEQFSGSANHVSGRSDVFSLGVILYELLTGDLPFGDFARHEPGEFAFDELLPPSLLAEGVPGPLERICLAALSPHPGERPDAAGAPDAFADSLEKWLHDEDSNRTESRLSIRAFPRGLHSFDGQDADAFVRLLPGPRNRDGIPDSISRWVSRIEEVNPDHTFRVGLIYGASGCGKSSFVKSGIIPRLSSAIDVIYLEAESNTADKLVRQVHHRFPRLSEERDLKNLLRRIRDGEGLPTGCKLLVVIDQFEQHLHRAREENDPLHDVLALCDGIRLQSLLVVRDDFWVGVSALFTDLSIHIDTGRNAEALDLFHRKHAEEVLIEFGRSLGCLPLDAGEMTPAQSRFVRQAVLEMADEEGQIAPIKLAILVERFQDRAWVFSELRSMGGMSGLGLSYLRECLSGPEATPGGAIDSQAAQRVLNALLPEGSSSIRGQSLSRSDLRKASGLGEDSTDFEHLIYLLNREYRLICPCDSHGDEDRHYNLSHDYLVPAVRKWIREVKGRTREGRAELLLRERADQWFSGQSARALPVFFEWMRIRRATDPDRWTLQEREVMRRSDRRYLVRAVGASAFAILCAFLLTESVRREEANRLYAEVQSEGLTSIGKWEKKLQRSKKWLVPRMLRDLESADTANLESFVLSALLYQYGEVTGSNLIEILLSLEPVELSAACHVLRPLDSSCREQLEQIGRAREDTGIGFRARMALLLSGDTAKEDSLIEEWIRRDVEDVISWAPVVLSLGDSAYQSVQKRFELPENYHPGKAYNYVVTARESAKVALAYASTGDFSRVRSSLRSTRRREQRTHLINYLKPSLIGNYDLWTNPREYSGNAHQVAGLLQAVAEVNWEDLTLEKRPAILRNVMKMYLSGNSAVHSSADYALARWKVYRPSAESRSHSDGGWFVSPGGIEMVVIPDIGGRRIAVASKELSRKAYLESSLPHGLESVAGMPFEDSPVQLSDPGDLYRYCNWLSDRGGLEPCFYEEGGKWSAYPNYLDRSGYRIPTEEEWRTACNGGSGLRFSFGNRVDSLQWHAYVLENTRGSARRVGLSRPNPHGLFDMLGNVPEWVLQAPPVVTSAPELPLPGIIGGGYQTPEKRFAEGIPMWGPDSIDERGAGVRLFRTMPVDSEATDP